MSYVSPSDVSYATQFLGFLMNGLAVMNTRQATRAIEVQFWCFWNLGVFLIGQKGDDPGVND